ncbi:MAG: sulfatase [Acidobacteria bacterium]|nr:sulfatase [Acidobacteriota bacterium]
MPVEVVDLVGEFRYAEVRRERPLIDLGTPSAAAALIGGWSWNETDPRGTTFVWAVGPRSEVGVFLAWERDLEVRMRCRAFRYPGSPAQIVSVLWDDVEVASLELEAGFMEGGFVVPAERATPGGHRLALVPAYFGRPEGAGDAGQAPRHSRKLSLTCDWIALGDGPVAAEARGEGDTLWIPAASEVSFFLEPEQDLELQWEGSAPRGVPSLDVVWEVEGAAPLTASITQESAPPLHLPLRPVGDQGPEAPVDDWLAFVRPARLTLRTAGGAAASGGEEAGVVLRRPRLTVDERDLPLPDRSAEEPSFDEAGVPEHPSPGGERPPASILRWIVDTLRVDRLGFHGHEGKVSPNFDSLAERSTVFERAIAQSSWTRPTVATLLTGVGPERHGIRELSHGMEESFATLPERLRELGYATAGFSANANVTADTGFAQGFDRFQYAAVDVDDLARDALAWLDELTARAPEQPFFLMILSVEPHASFAPAEPFRSRFAAGVDDPELGSVAHLKALSGREATSTPDVVEKLFLLYDGEIAWNDHVFGEVKDELGRRGLDPLIAVIADHGEAFEERGVFGHAWDLHREVLDIPFFIHLPGQTEGRRVALPVQQADLLPTLIEMTGGEPGPDIEGDSLAPLLRGGAEDVALSAQPVLADRLLLSTMDTFRRPAASLVRGRYKLIELRRPGHAPTRLLFDWVDDPEERRDLVAERPILAGRLARLLREQVELSGRGAVRAPEVEVDEETRRRLQALGYIE